MCGCSTRTVLEDIAYVFYSHRQAVAHAGLFIRAKTGAVVHCGACFCSVQLSFAKCTGVAALLVRWIIRRNRARGSGTIDMCRGMLSQKCGWLPSKANITVVPPEIKKIARPTSLLRLLVAKVVMSSGYRLRRMLRQMLGTWPKTHTTSM